MEKLKLPAHPTQNIKCRLCRHYLKSEEEKVAYSRDGQIHKMKDVIAQGIPTEGMVSGVIAWCTALPTWVMVNDDHYCGKYEGNISLVADYGKQ